jgi:hypothetical protein
MMPMRVMPERGSWAWATLALASFAPKGTHFADVTTRFLEVMRAFGSPRPAEPAMVDRFSHPKMAEGRLRRPSFPDVSL